MGRLMKTDIKSTVTSTETIVGLVVEIISGLFEAWVLSYEGMKLISMLFINAPAAVFIAYAVSNDNNYGTIRNRITAGFGRRQILFSKILAGMLLSVLYCIVGLLPSMILLYDQFFSGSFMLRLMIIMCSFITVGAVSAVISTVIGSRTGAILLVIALYIGSIYWAVKISFNLDTERSYTWNEQFQAVQNPKYISGVLRPASKLLTFSVPYGQYYLADETLNASFKSRKRDSEAEAERDAGPDAPEGWNNYKSSQVNYYNERETDVLTVPVYTLAVILIISGVAVIVFRRKDIN